MTMGELFAAVESPETEIRVNAASDLRTFRRALADIEAFRQLFELAWQPDVQREIARKFVERTKDDGGGGFRHRFDVALSAYLLLLSETSSRWIRPISDIASDVPDTWWLQKVLADTRPSQPHPERLLAGEPTHIVVYDSGAVPTPSLVANLLPSSVDWGKRIFVPIAYVKGEVDVPIAKYTPDSRAARLMTFAVDSLHFEGWVRERDALFPHTSSYEDSTSAASADVEIHA